VRRTRVLIALAVATATIATGAGTAYATLGKSVTVTVDGSPHTVHTFARTVAGALDGAGVRYDSHDLVVPDGSSTLRRGAQLTVRHARALVLTVDGERRQVWVLADSVGEALDQLGFGRAGAALSASRSRAIPIAGLDLSVRLPHRVTLVADGKTRRLVTVDPTVRAVLAHAGIALAATDRVSVALTSYPTDAETIRVTRVRSKVETERSSVAFSTVRRADRQLSQGTTRTVTAGASGTVTRTYLATYVDGRRTTRKLTATTTTPSRTRVVEYGTKASPTAAPAAHTTRSSAHATSSSGSSHSGGTGGLNWAALAACESGGNLRSVNPSGTYRGLYQFSISTWQALGGSGDPIDASAAEQTARAYLLYQRSGAGQWPACGPDL